MSDMEDLYQEIILDHNKRPRNFRAMGDASSRAEGNNPMCGDEIEVFLKVEGDRIQDVSFQGQGCAISRASASLMSQFVKNKSISDAREAFRKIRESLGGGSEMKLEELGDIAALSGVRRFPARIKCATLAWHAMEAALEGQKEITTE